MRLAFVLLAAFAWPAMAAADLKPAALKPQIVRVDAKPQAVGTAHTLRTIPEACVRIEGLFTGDAAKPYKFAVVRISPKCQPRAQFIDAVKAQPSVAGGWTFKDQVRVPNASCGTQLAVVKVWHKQAAVAPPKADGQGQSRIYLEDQRKNAAANKLAALPMFAAVMAVEGKACIDDKRSADVLPAP